MAFAVDRFVSVGEQIAAENEDVAEEMREACEEAKKSGQTIFNLTSSAGDSVDDGVPNAADKSGMVRAARSLLSAVTRVLIIADSVVVKRLLAAVKKVKKVLDLFLNSQLFGSFVWNLTGRSLRLTQDHLFEVVYSVRQFFFLKCANRKTKRKKSLFLSLDVNLEAFLSLVNKLTRCGSLILNS